MFIFLSFFLNLCTGIYLLIKYFILLFGPSLLIHAVHEHEEYRDLFGWEHWERFKKILEFRIQGMFSRGMFSRLKRAGQSFYTENRELFWPHITHLHFALHSKTIWESSLLSGKTYKRLRSFNSRISLFNVIDNTFLIKRNMAVGTGPEQWQLGLTWANFDSTLSNMEVKTGMLEPPPVQAAFGNKWSKTTNFSHLGRPNGIPTPDGEYLVFYMQTHWHIQTLTVLRYRLDPDQGTFWRIVDRYDHVHRIRGSRRIYKKKFISRGTKLGFHLKRGRIQTAHHHLLTFDWTTNTWSYCTTRKEFLKDTATNPYRFQQRSSIKRSLRHFHHLDEISQINVDSWDVERRKTHALGILLVHKWFCCNTCELYFMAFKPPPLRMRALQQILKTRPYLSDQDLEELRRRGLTPQQQLALLKWEKRDSELAPIQV